ncbi:MAG: DUF1287 domain-containing protein [Clostridia bacterium]|nr:DUF1287 domain-containing protein [Clostridia bacterium]
MKVIHGIFLGIIILIIIVVIAISISLFIFPQNKIAQRILNGKVYYASDFGIEILISKTDYDNDGIDDYTDILQGAKIEAENKPKYKSAYYSGGYPPDDEGVCTDVIWRALKNAGYSLKDMVDEDIKNNIEEYLRVGGKPDPNIDFRRVPNLKVYFERNQISLTTDLSKIEEWQPGDIVVFGSKHIGIISDKRNKDGIPYLIHNANQPLREENALELYNEYEPITGHYRMK